MLLTMLVIIMMIMICEHQEYQDAMQGCTWVRVDAASRCTCSGGYDALQSFENAAEISDRSAAATAVLLIALLVIQGQ